MYVYPVTHLGRWGNMSSTPGHFNLTAHISSPGGHRGLRSWLLPGCMSSSHVLLHPRTEMELPLYMVIRATLVHREEVIQDYTLEIFM